MSGTTGLSFPTALDRTPADDEGLRFWVIWRALNGQGLAHCYPSESVGKRSHLCQGRYLSKLTAPVDPSGKTRLYARAKVREFLKFCRDAPPVCASCFGVLHWLAGQQAIDSVNAYRLRQRDALDNELEQPRQP